MSSGPEGTCVMIVGCGNPLRGDDGVGIAAVRLLQKEISGGDRRGRWPNLRLDIVEVEWPGLALLDLLGGAEVVLIVDAVVTGARPGTVHRFDVWEFVRTGTSACYSPAHPMGILTSHDLGLATILSLGCALRPERLPSEVVIWGVEPGAVGFGERLTRRVATAVPVLVASLGDDLTRWQKAFDNGLDEQTGR